MPIVELGLDDGRWREFVDGHPDALVYHHPAWVRTLNAAYGYEPLVLGSEADDGRLAGVLPLMRKRGLVTGRRLSSLPHTPVAGPLAADPASATALMGAAAARARADGADLELKCEAAVDAGSAALAGGEWSTSYTLPLPQSVEEVRFGNSRNHGRIKWAVNKAARSGVAVRDAATTDDLAHWHRLYLETMRSHAVPPRPYAFFRSAWEVLRPAGLMRLLVAERTDEAGRARIIAGAMLFTGRSAVLYAYNGRAAAELATRPNDVLQWHAIHDAVAAGARRYDFGEVEEDQQGLSEFKKKWGATPVTLHRYTLEDGKGARAPGPASRPRARQLAENAWRRLPLGVTARLGAAIYRRL